MPKLTKYKQAISTGCTLIVRQSESGVKPKFCQITWQDLVPVVW